MAKPRQDESGRPKVISLDTQVFDALAFNFSHENIKTLIQHVEHNHINIILTSITVGEIKARIKDHIKHLYYPIRQIIKKSRFVPSISGTQLGGLLDKNLLRDTTDNLLGKFDEFLKRAKVHIISVEGVNPEIIFAKYFGESPPFSAGNKKAEFPDAFAIASLSLWAKNQKITITVVSGDNDWKSACKANGQLRYIEKLAELLQTLPEPEIVQKIKDSLDQQVDNLGDAIGNEFESLGFYVSDVDGDVDEIRAIQVDPDNVYVISIVGEEAKVQVECSIKFQADVSYDDPETGIWDNEEQVLLMADRVSGTVEDTLDATVIIGAKLDGDGKVLKINTVRFISPAGDIQLNIDKIIHPEVDMDDERV